jgi:hypothetical protein
LGYSGFPDELPRTPLLGSSVSGGAREIPNVPNTNDEAAAKVLDGTSGTGIDFLEEKLDFAVEKRLTTEVTIPH